MPTNAITRLRSITKTITAAAVMILYGRGQIDLNDRVSDYLPEYADVKVAAKDEYGEDTLVYPETAITIYHLLTHQSAIASKGQAFWGVWDEAKNLREFASLIAAIPLESHPGKVFNYGRMGSSYELLAAIVEVVSGKSYNEFLRHEILDPLKMENTFFYVPESKKTC